MISKATTLAVLAALAASAPANAAVTISTAATQNMNCTGGTCVPTAAAAVLNVTDLENLLASGNVTVTTTGKGIEARGIRVVSAFGWSAATGLALTAHQRIAVEAAVSVSGAGSLSLTTSDLLGFRHIPTLYFAPDGSIAFANMASKLIINGSSLLLEDSVAALAAAIAANPRGAFALARTYNAKRDGTYSKAPVTVHFTGFLEGLGNSIRNLSIDDPVDDVGLFQYVDDGVVRDINLVDANVTGHFSFAVGALAAHNTGWIVGVSVSGATTGFTEGDPQTVGGLVGFNTGQIWFSHSTALVTGEDSSVGQSVGGLVGTNEGVINESWANGTVAGGSEAGGLIGIHDWGKIKNSYAMGDVTGSYGGNGLGGGLVGESGSVHDVALYSTGAASGGEDGGFAGSEDQSRFRFCYWDTTTSGLNNATAFEPKHHGITGLTTQQLQSGLPAGFDPQIWAEDANINEGLPYLINNPPPQ